MSKYHRRRFLELTALEALRSARYWVTVVLIWTA